MSNEEKYLLWAATKSWHHNSPVFWGKNNCGYYSTLEDCEQYTLEQALKHATKDDIPVKISDLMPFAKTSFHDVNMVLNNAEKEFKNRQIKNDDEIHDCSNCARLDIETFTGVCSKFGVINDVKVDCNFWEKGE